MIQDQPMNQGEPTSSADAQPGATVDTVDVEKLNAFKSLLDADQNFPAGALAGVGVAIVGAAVWAVITVTTKFQIGWMAVGVGFLVGHSVRVFGKGISKSFGILGASCALGGCVLGNLLSVCGFLSHEESVPLLPVVLKVLSSPGMALELLKITFTPMDLLFYAIAVYEGYKFSFRHITQQELAALARTE